MGNIIIHSELGKKLIELTEDELIIRRFLHRKRIKRSNIRSAYLLDNSLNILTYNNKCIVAQYIFIKGREVDNIKRIIDEVNKENILFNLNQNVFVFWGFLVWCVNPLINIIQHWGENNYFEWILFIIMLILVLTIYRERQKNKQIKYYIDKKEFAWTKGRDKYTKNYPIKDIELVKNYDMFSKYKFKNEKEKIRVIKKIDYPLTYRFALEEIEKIASGKSSLEKL